MTVGDAGADDGGTVDGNNDGGSSRNGAGEFPQGSGAPSQPDVAVRATPNCLAAESLALLDSAAL